MINKDNFQKIFGYIYNLISTEFKTHFEILKDARKRNNANPLFCKDIHIISDIIIIIIWIFLITSLLWILYEIIKNVVSYFQLSSYKYFMTRELKFSDSPLFKQLENIFYLNDYFSIDTHFAMFIITLIFIIVKIDIFDYLLKEKRIEYIKVFCYISILIGFIYYLINYTNITKIGKRVNSINRLFYTNINVDFINKKKICNYLTKKNEFDNEFVYGKCNDIKNNISINRFYEYIKEIMDDIGETHTKSFANISLKEFKSLKDKNGIFYKDKIVSTFFTFQILKYFVDNNLISEAKDFFSAFNMIYTPNIQIIKKKINPVLYLRIDNLMIFESLYQFEGELKNSFYNDKDKFEYIKFEYTKLQNQIQKIVIDIYDICSSKLISIYMYYFILFILIIILIIVYQFNIKFKFPFNY